MMGLEHSAAVRTRTAAMHAHDRRIDHLYASPPPPNEAIVASRAGTIGLRQIPLRSACAQHPKDAVQDTPVIDTRHTRRASIRRVARLRFRLVLCAGANPATIDTANFSFSARAQLDNIVVDNVAAVAEASTLAMIILGFAGFGFMAYRRKMIVVLAAA
jgi:hypothetical protein